MKRNSTLSEITAMMEKIGCFNKAYSDEVRHRRYLSESKEYEEYKFGNYRDIKKSKDANADENTKVEITDTYAILYNASKANSIESLLQKGTNMEYVGSSAGTAAWGKGIYTNFQRYQAHYRTVSDKGLYGSVLIKFKYHGNLLEECLVSEPQLWKRPLSEQVRRFPGLEKFLTGKGININGLDSLSYDGNVSSGGMSVIREACGGAGRMSDVLLGFGVQGVVFFGHNDRPVAVIYDADKLEILNYADNTSIRNLHADLEWKGLKNGEGGRTAGNDINPILMYFKKFDGNKNYTRPQFGEILMTDKETGKQTFIDYNNAKEIIASHSDGDPRLFGDFEFEMAQNFSNINGHVLAFVQIDKDESSQFYINKDGFLYKNPSESPVLHIDEYYSDTKNGDNEDFDFDIDDEEDFSNFKKMFAESIMRTVLESVQNETRTETPDGHVELDNFDLARKIMKFNGPDDAYFIKIAERHKDHPDRYYEHDACDYKGFFEVVSVEHLNAIEPVIKRLCRQGEWRAMMYINPRPMGDTRDFAHNVLEPRFKKHNSHMQGHEVEVAYGQSKDWDNRPMCFIDVDTDDEETQKKVIDYVEKMGLRPVDMYKTTNNGLHIILPDKEQARRLDFSFLDKGKNLGKWSTAGLEVDKSITLYAYVKAQGYGTQQRMQKKLGVR